VQGRRCGKIASHAGWVSVMVRVRGHAGKRTLIP
jgi:hypothetical protein